MDKFQWSDVERQLANLKNVEGGFSQAHRGLLAIPDGRRVFVKIGTDERTKKWAQKEIAVYRFLERHAYRHCPRLLAASDDESAFVIEAFVADDGWDWHDNWSDERLNATLQAMDDLAAITLDEDERAFFSEKNLGHDEDGWKPLRDSREKQVLLLQRLHGIGAEDIASGLDFPAEAARGARYDFADDRLVHYDMRADNCAWNAKARQVRIVDWNWAQLGDEAIELAATLTHVQKSGHDLPKELREKLNPEALHWMAGFWLYNSTNPMWEGGPEHLRDFQLLAGVTALRLEREL